MGKHLQLHIPQPCHEDWDSMTASERGRFCNSCQKQVIDFTNMTDSQLAAFFKKPSTGEVCGRFMNDQLDKNITIPRKEMPWIKYAFTLSIPLLLSSLRTYAQGKPQISYVKPTVNEHELKESIALTGFVIKGEVVKKSKTGVRGRIIDSSGKPVPFATILVSKSNVGVAADSSGNFILDIKRKDLMILEVSAVGFSATEVSAKSNEDLGDILLEDIKELEPVVVKSNIVTMQKYSTTVGFVSTVMSGVMGGVMISAVVNSAEDVKEGNDEKANVRVYPNPVNAGKTITIEAPDEQDSKVVIELYNLSGQLLYSVTKSKNSANSPIPFSIPTSVSPGIYFVKLNFCDQKKSKTIKIIVQK